MYICMRTTVRVISLAVHSGHNVVMLGEDDVILIDTCERLREAPSTMRPRHVYRTGSNILSYI